MAAGFVERRKQPAAVVREEQIADHLSVGAELVDGSGKIDDVPEGNGRNDEIETDGPRQGRFALG